MSTDADFASPLDREVPRQFLADEWKARRLGTLRLHSNIKVFFKAKFDLEFASQVEERKAAIKALLHSLSFASTHAAIAELEPYVEFLDIEDIVELAKGALENTQIRWIATDDDVHGLYSKILPKVPPESMNAEDLAKLKELFANASNDTLSDILGDSSS